jgi:hypothetical protein
MRFKVKTLKFKVIRLLLSSQRGTPRRFPIVTTCGVFSFHWMLGVQCWLLDVEFKSHTPRTFSIATVPSLLNVPKNPTAGPTRFREPTIYGPKKIPVDIHCTAMYLMVHET